ncbi:MAG: TonB-dependent receptor [Gammaproteobacteria bacterium]|nr:TonB-dependent receptor [Gammaproteobacteria bacterium]
MKAKNKGVITLAGIVLGCTLLMDAACVGAREESMDDLLSLSLKELLNVEITGSTLREENLHSVPSSATVFSGEEIRRMGISDMESLMNYVPGFQSFRIDDSGSNYTFSARGRRASGNSREVLVLVDGQRMSNVASAGSSFLTPLLSTENVKRVEFIRGPGSALYGSNAFLGVVNIITDKSLNEIEAAAGSFAGGRAHVNYSYAGDELEAAVFVKYFQDEGEKYSDIYDSTNKHSAATRDPRNGFDLYLSTEYKGWAFKLSHIRRRDEQFYVVGNFSNSFNAYPREYSYANLSYAWNWLQQVDSVVKIGCRHSRMEYHMPLMPAGALAAISTPSGSKPLLTIAPFEEQEPIITFHNALHMTGGYELQFGMEYRRPEMTDITVSNNYDLGDLSNGRFPVRYYAELLPTTPIGKERTRSVLGLYGQYQFSPWKPLTVTAGVRYDRYADFGSSTNPRLALVYRPQKKTALKLLYGEAFRAPAFIETDTINNPLVIGNPDLKPEKSKTWEFIWMQRFERAHFALTWFDALMADSIGIALTDGPFRTFANSGEEKSRGFEFEISAELTDNMLLRGTLTHFTEIPDRAFRESTDMASLIVNYHKNKWNFNLSANRQGDKQFQYKSADGMELRNLGSFVAVNTKLEYDFTSDIMLFAQVDNLFDKDYLTPPQETKNPLGMPNRGRRFEVGVNWAF